MSGIGLAYAEDSGFSYEEHADEMFPLPERFYDPNTRDQQWHTKLSTDLLQLVDPRYHSDGLDTTAALLEMKNIGLVRLSEMGEPQINVMVYLQNKGRFEDIYRYLSDSSRDTTTNMIAGWIKVDDLKSAALLSDVTMITTVLPPVSSTISTRYDVSDSTFNEALPEEGGEELDEPKAEVIPTSPPPITSLLDVPLSPTKQSPWETKLSSDLIQLLDPNARPPGQSHDDLVSVLKATGVLRVTSDPTKMTESDEVLVDAWVHEGRDVGYMNYFSHFSYDPTYHRIAGWIDLQNLALFAQHGAVLSVSTVLSPSTSNILVDDAFPVDSTAIVELQNFLGYTGKNIRIGVISDGITGFEDAVTEGTLPPITILRDQVGGSEGVLMMQIIHAIAPDAQLIFHDRGHNQIEFVQAIDKLISAGAHIICDDITYIEPFFEDGYIATNVRDRILTYGVLYVTSAGNMALRHYQGTFSEVEHDGYKWHGFGNDETSSLLFRVSSQTAGHVVLQWDERFGAATTNYDLFLYDENGSEVGRSVNVQDGDGDPIEWVRFLNESRDDKEYTVKVVLADGNGNSTLELFVLPLTGQLLSMSPQTSEDSIFGQQAVPEVLCVTAAGFENGAVIKAPYASQGPVTIRYPYEEIREKPDIAAPGTVRIPGTDRFEAGTSFSAPQVAGIAALLLEEDPDRSEFDIRKAIIGSGGDMSGYSPDLGYGLIHAKNAHSLLFSLFPIPTSETRPCSLTPLPPESYGGIILYPGWNMISVPASMALEGLTGADLFPIDTGGRTIWTYDHMIPDWVAVKPEKEIYAYDVFWVYSKHLLSLHPSSDAVLSSPAPKEIPLFPGWNPLGVTWPDGVTADSFLSSVSDSWSHVLTFDACAQTYRQAIIKGSSEGGFSDSRMLSSGEGFWVYMRSPATFSYPLN